MKHLLPILALCVFSGPCTSEKDATELLLFVTASDTSAAAGEIVYFDIEARSLDSRIDTVSVRTYDKENGPLPLFSDRPLRLPHQANTRDCILIYRTNP